MFTRKQYLNKECTFDQYYGQFVNERTISYVIQYIGKEELLNSPNDNHFNNIPLIKWDRLAPRAPGSAAFKEVGDYYTLAGGVCLLKAAAKIYKERTLAQTGVASNV